MTTNIVVTAHCASEKEVEICLTVKDKELESVYLDDGDQYECVVYDDRVISVQEHDKHEIP